MMEVNGHLPVIDADLGTVSLQPAFVEGISRDGKRFSSIEAAYRHILRGNLEWGILLWSGIPVRISYRDDLPALVGDVIDLLEWIRADGMGEQRDFHFSTPNLETSWRVKVTGEIVEIRSEWRCVAGVYEACLNETLPIWMRRVDFLREWKLLLEQLVRAIDDAGARLTEGEARADFQRLQEIADAIPGRGRFYRYDDGVR